MQALFRTLALGAGLMLAGCATPGKALGPSDFTLQVAPEVSGPRQVLAVVDPYASSSVGRIELELSDTTVIPVLVATAALLPGDFHKVVTFAQLRHLRQYTIEAEAYASDGVTVLTAEATPVVVNVGTESAVGAATIAIRLRDRAFDGTGTGNFPIASGTLTSADPEAITTGAQWMVSTLSGSGAKGYAEGPADLARFKYPEGFGVDGDGSVIVADTGNNVIRRIDGSGNSQLLAGYPESWGGDDGDALASATFAGPTDIAIDGNVVYIVDWSNNCIRRLEDGVVTTLAGDPEQWGYQDGVGTGAHFDQPSYAALGPDGNLYVTDSNNHRIRMVTPSGVVTTVAGAGYSSYDNGASGVATFYYPTGIAVDPSGTIYVADKGNHAIRKVATDGQVTTFAGAESSDSPREGHADELGTAARFRSPMGLALDGAGKLLVADFDNNCIRQVDIGTRQVKTLAGSRIASFYDGPARRARFNRPIDVAVGSGVVYVLDYENHRIRKIQDPALPTY